MTTAQTQAEFQTYEEAQRTAERVSNATSGQCYGEVVDLLAGVYRVEDANSKRDSYLVAVRQAKPWGYGYAGVGRVLFHLGPDDSLDGLPASIGQRYGWVQSWADGKHWYDPMTRRLHGPYADRAEATLRRTDGPVCPAHPEL